MLHRRTAPLGAAIFAACSLLSAQTAVTTSFTVSMPQPANHLFHVTMRCEGLRGEFHDFNMPAWAPGYYRILDFEKNVRNFAAADGAGRALAVRKEHKELLESSDQRLDKRDIDLRRAGNGIVSGAELSQRDARAALAAGTVCLRAGSTCQARYRRARTARGMEERGYRARPRSRPPQYIFRRRFRRALRFAHSDGQPGIAAVYCQRRAPRRRRGERRSRRGSPAHAGRSQTHGRDRDAS